MAEETVLTRDNTRILVCCHDPCALPEDESGILMPIGTGSVLDANDWGKGSVQRDDRVNGEVCENISERDKSFCELTKWYWAWKNMKKVCPGIEYIGSFHYRRYFSFNETDPWVTEIIKKKSEIGKYRLDVKKLQRMLTRHDLVVSKPFIFPLTLYMQYCICCQRMDIVTLVRTMNEVCPEYRGDVYDIIYNNNLFIGLNMFVMKWSDFDAYCKWLFGILFEVDKRINYSYYSPYQARVISFLSERLFHLYIHHNFKKPKYLNVLFFTDAKQNKNRIFNFLKETLI